MSRKLSLILSAYLAAFAVGGAAASSLQSPEEAAEDAAKLAAARANAATPVEHVRFLRAIDSIEIVDAQAVLVWETPFKAWLVDLEVSPACRDIEQNIALGIDSMDQSLNVRTGYLVAEHGVRCKMTQIREVDVKAMNATIRESGNG